MARLVVALGGNALMDSSKNQSFEEQLDTIKQTAKFLVPLAEKNQLILTHGNGPQVGNILLQQESSKKTISQYPLDVCGAMTQGSIGYMIQRAIENEFRAKGQKKEVSVVLTQVVVNKTDSSFKNPEKFVGPVYNKRQALTLKRKFPMKEDPRGGWRKVVASPMPKDIWEKHEIITLIEAGFIVICCGGGGIPVIKKGKKLHGVEAVIDKDMAASELAVLTKADELLILTDVDNALINFKKPNQEKIGKIKYSELKKLYEQGEFGAGSMKPKVGAVLRFIERGGNQAIITSLKKANLALKGKAGTIVLPD